MRESGMVSQMTNGTSTISSNISLAVVNQSAEIAAWMHAPIQRTQLFLSIEGRGGGVPSLAAGMSKIHSGMLESLLSAAAGEDARVSQLLEAFDLDDLGRVEELARLIAVDRQEASGFTDESKSNPPSRSVTYQDKLLAAIYREEMLLDKIIAASVRGERPQLFRLCHELTTNRKRFDREFRRKINTIKEPDL
jgi:hypothetical protein